MSCVLVAADEILVGEAIRSALAARGLGPVELARDLDWLVDHAHEGLPALAGLLVAEIESFESIERAETLVARSVLPWVVVTSTPRGAGWGAVLNAGACRVLESSVDLREVVAVLDEVVQGRNEPVVADPGLFELWRQTKREREDLVDRLCSLTSWEATVLRLSSAGWSAAEVAATHDVPVGKVDEALEATLAKLDLRSQLEVIGQIGELLDSVRAGVTDDRAQGAADDAQVQCKGPVVDVVQVQTDGVLPREVGTSRDLP